MRLSDLMSAMSPTQLTEVALLLFLGVFVAVGVRAWRTVPAERERNARMPLEDERTVPMVAPDERTVPMVAPDDRGGGRP